MPDQESQYKLSVKEQLNLCALLAVGYNPRRCCDVLSEKFGITVSVQNVYQSYLDSPKWKKIIFRMRREAERRVLSHPIAKTVNRLNILLDAINEAFIKHNIGIIASLVREAREEIEGTRGTKGTDIKIGIGVNINANGNSNGAVDKELQEQLRRDFLKELPE